MWNPIPCKKHSVRKNAMEPGVVLAHGGLDTRGGRGGCQPAYSFSLYGTCPPPPQIQPHFKGDFEKVCVAIDTTHFLFLLHPTLCPPVIACSIVQWTRRVFAGEPPQNHGFLPTPCPPHRLISLCMSTPHLASVCCPAWRHFGSSQCIL